MTIPDIVYLLLFIVAFFAALTKKLTIPGAIAGFVVAVCIFEGGRLISLIELAAFFTVGTLATSIGIPKKRALGIAEENKGRRTAGQVLANGGVAALLSIFNILFLSGLFYIPYKWPHIIPVMIAGGLAAATADTLSSELGNIYGRNFYNIITLKKDKRGLDGVISFEGTLAGVLGATIIALIYFFGTDNLLSATFVLFSGIIGGLIDSVLGATLERRSLLTNNWVNFLNTMTGAATAGLLYIIFK